MQGGDLLLDDRRQAEGGGKVGKGLGLRLQREVTESRELKGVAPHRSSMNDDRPSMRCWQPLPRCRSPLRRSPRVISCRRAPSIALPPTSPFPYSGGSPVRTRRGRQESSLVWVAEEAPLIAGSQLATAMGCQADNVRGRRRCALLAPLAGFEGYRTPTPEALATIHCQRGLANA